ncbi:MULTISPECIES: XtrA/YqaO family protein [Bacillus]|uniref:XtrA/YqaO family protein n=1 Tax=Bacillus TaxID=1386 RepID=UPI0003FCE978|nr:MULTISPECIES: XtrA/YqaO family protein [Bacillus]MCY8573583.1 XtrA/YqaO family protein [Bacillus haynesii]MCY8592982.1 XtrA/YqaO family protein [Bacillus haynesii]QHZ46350.1 terminase [Bacillus sp. NSP9.1]
MKRKRGKEVDVNSDLTFTEQIEKGKVTLLVLDGHSGKVKKYEAVEHGSTVVETTKGKIFRVRFDDYELF